MLALRPHALSHPPPVAAREFLLYRFRKNSLERRGRELEVAFAYSTLLKVRKHKWSASKNEVLMEMGVQVLNPSLTLLLFPTQRAARTSFHY